MARAEILAGLLCLGLTAIVRAQEPASPDQKTAEGRATLLAAPVADHPPDLIAEMPSPSRPPRRDPAVQPAWLTEQSPSPEQQTPAEPGQPVPSIAVLPAVETQANPATGANRTQAGAPTRTQQPRAPTAQPPTRPAPPAARPPTGPQQRGSQPANRPAADVAQEVQIDRNGLVTMHVNELEVRQLLEFLSRRSGANILVSPKVAGTVSANFEGVTLQDVIDAIIKLANLVDKKEGNIHFIYTKDEVQDEAEFTKKERILTKVYKLSYVRADEILGVIRPFLSPDVGRQRLAVTPSYRFGISESATFVSGGGQGASAGGGGAAGGAGGMGGPGAGPTTGSGPTIGGFQPPTGGNSLADYDHLIIQDYESNLKIIDQIIQRIDVRPIQVLIEAVIISVDYEHDRELGVNLGLVNNLGTTLGTVGTGPALNGNVGFTPTKLLTAAGKIAQGPVTDAQGFTSASNGIKFGFVANNVTGFIRALETIGNTKILASPRILVLNKQRAEIQLGSRLGFQTLSQNFTSTIQQVQFLNTGTLLRLRPFVSDDGMVRMEVHPERSSGTVTNNIPNQNTAELTTNVMVPDGSTLVIGGLIEDEDDFSYQGLPLLSRFPALGFLTGTRVKTEGRRELVVLLTPHIWSIEQAMAHAPPPHPGSGAFSATGPIPNGSTAFDLETGRVGAGTATTGATGAAPTDPAGDPATSAAMGAMAAAPTAGLSAAAPADGRSMIASSGGPGPNGVTPSASSGRDSDPRNASTAQRRRWPSLREWMSKRSRDKQADPSVGGGTVGQPMAQGAVAAVVPQSASSPLPAHAADPESADRADGSALPSPQQVPQPDSGRPNLDLGPEAATPIGAVRSERVPRRDPMLAQAAWRPDRVRRDEERLPAGRSPRRDARSSQGDARCRDGSCRRGSASPHDPAR